MTPITPNLKLHNNQWRFACLQSHSTCTPLSRSGTFSVPSGTTASYRRSAETNGLPDENIAIGLVT